MSARLCYSPIFTRFVARCSRLRSYVRAAGREVAAFHVPSRVLFELSVEAGHDLYELTIFNRPVYAHHGSGGIIAEKGRWLSKPKYALELREA